MTFSLHEEFPRTKGIKNKEKKRGSNGEIFKLLSWAWGERRKPMARQKKKKNQNNKKESKTKERGAEWSRQYF